MNRKLILRGGVLVFFFLLSIFAIFWWQKEDRKGILKVAFLNVGQGDAIFIEGPNGNQILIDGGKGKSVLRELGEVMSFYDRSIDVVIATHPDADHIGGLVDVFDVYEVSLFIEPGVLSDTSVHKALQEKVAIEKTKTGPLQKIEARRGMVIDLGGGARFEILYPVVDMKNSETNTASIVGRLVYGETEFMLTGDSPSNIEQYLISLEDRLQGGLEADVLKAGHHGSKTSTSPEFVTAVDPEYAIISAGKDNRYDHPAPTVLATLEKAKVQILRTDTMGRIIFISDGKRLQVVNSQ